MMQSADDRERRLRGAEPMKQARFAVARAFDLS
jgi:hypothetical protein